MRNKLPLFVSVVWFVVAGLWASLFIKDLAAGSGSMVMNIVVLAVALFAALSNLRLYLKNKKK